MNQTLPPRFRMGWIRTNVLPVLVLEPDSATQLTLRKDLNLRTLTINMVGYERFALPTRELLLKIPGHGCSYYTNTPLMPMPRFELGSSGRKPQMLNLITPQRLLILVHQYYVF